MHGLRNGGTPRRASQPWPGVEAVAPYVELQALAVRQPEMVPILLRGIDPAAAASRADLGTRDHAGAPGRSAARLRRACIVGAVIAERLGLAAGDSLTLLIPTVSADGAPTPKLREFTVAGVFEVGLQDHDGTLVLADLEDVRALAPAGAASEGLRVRLRRRAGGRRRWPRALRAQLAPGSR